MCKVMDRVMVGEGQSYPASCVNCHKTQTIYEKSIGGLRDLRSCKWGWIYFIIQISVTITDTVAHNYNTKFIEISIDHLHIYKVFMAWQIDLQRCMCIHCNRTHTFFRMDRQFLVIGKFRIHTCVCVCMYIHTFWKLEKRKSLLIKLPCYFNIMLLIGWIMYYESALKMLKCWIPILGSYGHVLQCILSKIDFQKSSETERSHLFWFHNIYIVTPTYFYIN